MYIDDIIKTSNAAAEKKQLMEKLASEFKMKDHGKPKYFLGIEISYSHQGIFICQRKHVIDLLKATGKLGCKATSIYYIPINWE